MARLTIAQQLDQAQRILSLGTHDLELRAPLAAVGYSAAAFAGGQSLYDGVLEARSARHAARGAQLKASEDLAQRRAVVEQQLRILMRVARAVAPDHQFVCDVLARRRKPLRQPAVVAGAEPVLDTSPKAQRRSGWRSNAELLDYGRLIYEALLRQQALLAELTEVGYGRERIERELTDVARLAAAVSAHRNAVVRTRKAVEQQGRALAALRTWIARFRVLAGVALIERQDLRSKLGI